MKLLLVDDHRIVRQVLQQFLKIQFQELEIVEAGNGVEAIQRYKKETFDIVITDINMPVKDGIELLQEIRSINESQKVIALSMMNDQVSVKKMLKLGVNAFVLKQGDTDELIIAIKKVMDGQTYFSTSVTDIVINSFTKKAQHTGTPLSNREKEILHLMFLEKSNLEIAETLSISQRTVETHKYNIMEKTGAKNLAGLVKYAIKEKLFDDLFY